MKILITGGSGFIGTNLMEMLLSKGYLSLKNIDIKTPNEPAHLPYWEKANLLDEQTLMRVFKSFQPDVVIHLAGRTDTDPANVLSDYEANTKGSLNLINCIQATPSINRVIFTSTQFVHQYNGQPQHDEDFAPHTVYGESKVIMEKAIRNAGLKCTWTIIRPTNIWGPWHLRYPFEFWKVLGNGMYFHPGRKPVMRSYGYVGNVAFQIIAMMESSPSLVDRKVFYVGDYAIDLYDWVNGFSRLQTGKDVRVVPRFLVRLLAIAGDILALGKIKFPINTSRYRSMTSNNDAPMKATIDAFGLPPYTLAQGILESVNWMKKYHPHLVRTKPGKELLT